MSDLKTAVMQPELVEELSRLSGLDLARIRGALEETFQIDGHKARATIAVGPTPAPFGSIFSLGDLALEASVEEGEVELAVHTHLEIGKGKAHAVTIDLSATFEQRNGTRTLSFEGAAPATPIALGVMMDELVSSLAGGLPLPKAIHDIELSGLDVELTLEQERERIEVEGQAEPTIVVHKNWALEVGFSLGRPTGSWEVIPGLLELGSEVEVAVSVENGVAEARIRDLVEFAGLHWIVEVELPYLIGKAVMVGEGPSLDKMLEHFHLHAPGHLGHLHNTSIGFDAKARQAEIHLELADWDFGVFKIANVIIDVDYTGGQEGGTSAKLLAEASIERGDDPPVTLNLSGEHPGPGQGWKVAGSMGVPPDQPITIAQVAHSFGIEDSSLGPVADLTGFGLTYLGVSYDSKAGDLKASCVLALTDEATLALDIERSHDDDGAKKVRFGGHLEVNGVQFDLIFAKDAKTAALVGAYHDPGGGPQVIEKLVGAFTDGGAAGLTSAFQLRVKSAVLAYEKNLTEKTAKPVAGEKAAKKEGAKVLLAFDMDAGIDLSGMGSLPLVGKAFADKDALKIALSPVITSKDFGADELEAVRDLLPAGSPKLPEKEITQRLQLETSLQLGGKRIELPLGLGGEDAAADPQLATPQAEPAKPDSTPPSPPSNITWVDVQKTLAKVVTLQRLGIGFEKPKIVVLIDGSISVGGLTLRLYGLGVRYNLETHHLSPTLHGLGLDLKRGPLEIGADFVNLDGDFVGRAILKMETFSLLAVGAFKMLDGEPSLFIYGVLDYPLGGPPCFFIEGLALGFGYNRHLTLPDIKGVSTFPLVQEAVGLASQPAGSADNEAVDPQAEMIKLHEVIYPSTGEYFLAVGVRFNSFKVIDAFALLTLSLDVKADRLVIALMGLATLKVPSESPELLAFIELQLLVKLDPMAGSLMVQAELTSKSWILSTSCHIQGGFGFGLWFGGEHAGDFVYSMGGYHPRFPVPDHYPQVPRLGYTWSIGSAVAIKGRLYYALTPVAFMAGGSYSATWHAGGLRAWFTLGADFLIQWKPFHYDAGIYVEIGASIKVFGSRVTVSIGADLQIHGPEFAGVAHCHFGPVSFSVSFGDKKPMPKPIPWGEFKHSFLPADHAKILSLKAASGLVKTVESGGKTWWVVNPKSFAIETETLLPITDVDVGPDNAHAPDMEPIQLQSFGVAPMERKKPAESKYTVTLAREEMQAEQEFTYKPLPKRFPAGVWGSGKQELDSKRTVDAVGGLRIEPHDPTAPGVTNEIERRKLDYSISHETMAANPDAGIEIAQQKPRHQAERDADRRAFTEAIADKKVADERDGILEALKIDPVRAVRLSADLPEAFIVPPQAA